MKKRLLGALLLAAFTFGAQAQKVLGYWPYYRTGISSIQYDNYTDLVYAFIEPTWNGTLEIGGDFNLSEFNSLVTNCNLNGVKAHISVGGANKSVNIANVASNPTYRATFVSEIVSFVAGTHPSRVNSGNTTPLAGMDIDWEFPTVNQTDEHLALCQELRAALDAQGQTDGRYYELGIAIDGSTPNMPAVLANYGTDYFDPQVINSVDYAFSMNYDLHYINYPNKHHSPLLAMTQAFDYYVNTLNWPAEKVMMGIPFYARNTSNGDVSTANGFKQIASSATYNDADGVNGIHTYNSKPLLEDKVNYICSNGGGGVLVWEVWHDDATYSLSKALKDAFDNSCASLACSQPDLGSDQSICEDPITLSIGVTPAQGETIKWYKNGIEISGETGSTYSTTEAGTYKGEINTLSGCSKSDEVVVSQSGDLQVAATNAGYFCTGTGPDSVTINVTGGGGFYNLYTTSTGGSPLLSGNAFKIDDNQLSLAQSQTYYIEEPSGQVATIGEDTRPTDDSNWANQTSDLGWNNDRQVFTTYADVTLQSIDFVLGYIGDNISHTLNVKVYDFGTDNIVAQKSFALGGTTDFNGPLNTMSLNFELAAGQYELSVIESNVLIWQTVGTQGSDIGYDGWNEAGIASLDGALDPDNRNWGVFKNANQGTYNWKFSTGTAAACGRVPVTVYHDCTTGSEELNANSLNVFPNPASDRINVTFETSDVTDARVELINSIGSVVSAQKLGKIAPGSQVLDLQTDGLSNGVYLVKVTTGNSSVTKTVVVSK